MPYKSFKEIKTPLALTGLRLFRCQESKEIYVKFGNNRRQSIRKMLEFK